MIALTTGAFGGCLVMAQLLLLGAASASPEPLPDNNFKNAFKRGLRYFDLNRWDEAVAYMRNARQMNAAEGSLKVEIYTRRRVVYYPGLYVGIALCRCEKGGCDDAIEEWKAWNRSGKPVDAATYLEGCQTLLNCRSECRQLVMRYAEAIGEEAIRADLPWAVPTAESPAFDIASDSRSAGEIPEFGDAEQPQAGR